MSVKKDASTAKVATPPVMGKVRTSLHSEARGLSPHMAFGPLGESPIPRTASRLSNTAAGLHTPSVIREQLGSAGLAGQWDNQHTLLPRIDMGRVEQEHDLQMKEDFKKKLRRAANPPHLTLAFLKRRQAAWDAKMAKHRAHAAQACKSPGGRKKKKKSGEEDTADPPEEGDVDAFDFGKYAAFAPAARPSSKEQKKFRRSKSRWKGGSDDDDSPRIADAFLGHLKRNAYISDEHAFMELMELAQQERRPRTDLYRAALRSNQCGCNVNAAEAISRRNKVVQLAAQRELNTLLERPHSKRAPRRFNASLQEVNVYRPFFFPPLVRTQRLVKLHATPDELEDDPLWNIAESIYARRQVEAEGKAFFDMTAMYKKRLANDWLNAIGKQRFMKVMAKADDQGAAGLKEEMEEIQEVFLENYPALCRIFNYYCSLQNANDESMFSLTFNTWAVMCRDYKWAKPKSKFCKQADLDNVFVATNFEEEKDSALADTNDDLALMRFEFLEALVRVAILKWGRDEGIADVSDSVHLLITEDILPLTPRLVLIDSNVFRMRLYCKETSDVFVKHQPLLQAIFAYFRTRGNKNSKALMLEGWLYLVEVCKFKSFNDPKTGEPYCGDTAKFHFMWSQMLLSDEVKYRVKLTSLSWVEFLEALGRFAEWLEPLTDAEEEAQNWRSSEADWAEVNKTLRIPEEWAAIEAPLGGNEVLAGKIERLLGDVVFANLMEEWGCSDHDKLIKKLVLLTKMSGGTPFGGEKKK